MSSALPTIGILGAGTMGSGIAQVAAQAGHPVVVFDKKDEQLASLKTRMSSAFETLVKKGKFTSEQSGQILGRIVTTSSLEDFAPCGWVIEAVIENLELKQKLLSSLEPNIKPQCILGSNTSSLSLTAIASACSTPERVIGIHFFNPAPIMKLVELVRGYHTGSHVLAETESLIRSWGKTPVIASDCPGFIVNRIARPFYSEALRLLEEKVATPATIDWAMRELGGFKMGPFELMDLIGIDVNLAVSEAVFRGFYYDPKYRPSYLQQQMIYAGTLGKKSGRGFYDYTSGIIAPAPNTDPVMGNAIFRRILALLINEAVDAYFKGLAKLQDIELAMTLGVNYPKGLLAWCNELGVETVLAELELLYQEYREERYRPSPLLLRMAKTKKSFTIES